MPQIDFTFSGWVRGAAIDVVTVSDSTGKIQTKNVRDEDPAAVATKLATGEYFISLGDYLYNNRKAEIELNDFEVSFDG